ncbi:putative LOB domain-containing protein 37 [Iris pallida]|uniref:LOB domain-containing protein 37 n=1 Tax=Iris pallida TaxID=29817 RepID=A0AAX6EVY2_IRIPA|nr:putative LOB domain-containing protein 37 [Iris pallida]KAJ6812864.1 putative LOB domain-containing protein 37 [Iris pallida]
MSCNGCRVLRKGCSESCVLRPCLQWIDGADAQGHATVFVAKFFGRAGLMSFISAVPEPQRPSLFQSLLFEACGRTINPVNGAVGLLWTGNWHLCQSAVETVLRGGTLRPLPDLDSVELRGGGIGIGGAMEKRKGFGSAAPDAADCDLDLCLTPRVGERKRRPTTPSMNSEGSVTNTAAAAESGGVDGTPRLLNLFV